MAFRCDTKQLHAEAVFRFQPDINLVPQPGCQVGRSTHRQMFRDEVSAPAFLHPGAGLRQILRPGLVGGCTKRKVGQSVAARNDWTVSRMRSRKMNGERTDRVPAEDAVAGDDDLKLVD